MSGYKRKAKQHAARQLRRIASFIEDSDVIDRLARALRKLADRLSPPVTVHIPKARIWVSPIDPSKLQFTAGEGDTPPSEGWVSIGGVREARFSFNGFGGKS